jgi:hypothetical protein
MKNRFLAAATALLILPAIQLQAFQGQGTGTANPPQTGEQPKQSPTSTPGPTPVKPVINDVVPAAPTISCNSQRLTLSGTGFQDKPSVTLTAPDGKKSMLTGADVTWVSAQEAQINATLSATGRWKVSLTNPDKSSADEVAFQVIDGNSPSVAAYSDVFRVVTSTLVILGLVLIIGLWRAASKGKWSLGTALSEEAAVQPQKINGPADVILVGSTSRLIALVGLLGILVIVLGIGYSIIWNLFVAGKSPDLSYVKSFLFGAASLFAPYLANQVRAAFDQTPAPAPASDDSSSLVITGVIPGSPRSAAGPQQLTLTGTGFDSTLAATLADPAGNETPIATAQLTINPTQLVLNVTLDAPGTWTVKVTGATGSKSASTSFAVYGAPVITAVAVSAAPAGAGGATDRDITLTGRGFLDGVKASLVPPGGGAAVTPTVKSRTYTQLVVTATLATGNNAQVTVTIPGGFAAAPVQFNVP